MKQTSRKHHRRTTRTSDITHFTNCFVNLDDFSAVWKPGKKNRFNKQSTLIVRIVIHNISYWFFPFIITLTLYKRYILNVSAWTTELHMRSMDRYAPVLVTGIICWFHGSVPSAWLTRFCRCVLAIAFCNIMSAIFIAVDTIMIIVKKL